MPKKKAVTRLFEFRLGGAPIWLTIYSDMITNLALFFLLMFALTRIETTKRMEILSSLEESFHGVKVTRAMVKEAIHKVYEEDSIAKLEEFTAKSNYAVMELKENMITLRLSAPVLFDTGRADLKPQVLPLLDELSVALSKLPNEVIVEGHTDNIPVTGGIYHSNWELSAGRAFSVINYLIHKGLSPKRFIAAGYGEYAPLYPNDTPEHRQLNRRIEIKIIR